MIPKRFGRPGDLPALESIERESELRFLRVPRITCQIVHELRHLPALTSHSIAFSECSLQMPTLSRWKLRTPLPLIQKDWEEATGKRSMHRRPWRPCPQGGEYRIAHNPGVTMDNKHISDTWVRGDPYEQYVGRWSRRVAPEFLSWLRVPPRRKWLDVGSGTGALCAWIVNRCSPSSVVGVEPSDGFLKVARKNLADRAVFHQGSAAAIPLDDASVDVVVSGLVLNFVPDQRAALAEMARVTRGDGTIAAYVWDYAGKMELMRVFWDAAVALYPDSAKLDEGIRFPVCNAEALEALFTSAGLNGPATTAIDIPTLFASFDDYWQPFLGGQGPAPAYVMSLDEPSRARLRDRIRERISVRADGSILLTARAWAVRASVA
jgi:SAM-dependent methyltransferase